MKKILLFPIMIFSHGLLACERLSGEWISSMEPSLEYAKTVPSIKENSISFIRQAFGHMRVTYMADSLRLHKVDDVDVLIDGKNYPFSFDESAVNIEYRNCNSDVVEITYLDSESGRNKLYLHFVSDNMYWISTNGSLIREYFVRIK